jgi:hypothetical protein
VLQPPGLTRHALVAGPEALDFAGANDTLLLAVSQDPFTWAAAMHDREPGSARAQRATGSDGEASQSRRVNAHASHRADALARRAPRGKHGKQAAGSNARWWELRRAAQQAPTTGSSSSGGSSKHSRGGTSSRGSGGGHSAAASNWQRAALAERVTEGQRARLTQFLESRWVDLSTPQRTTAQGHAAPLPPVEYASVVAMRTVKLQALLSAVQQRPHLRFAAVYLGGNFRRRLCGQ